MIGQASHNSSDTADPGADLQAELSAASGGGPISGILASFRDIGDDERPSVGRLMDILGGASFAYVLLGPALIVVTPLSGIPLLSSACGITIALVSAQMIAGRRHIWLPHWLRSRRIPRERLVATFRWLRQPLQAVDRITRQRLRWLVRRPLVLVPQVLCLLCGLAMPVLELVPLSSSILGAAVACLAIALVAGDGLFALGGTAVIGSGVWLLVGSLLR